MKSRGIVDLGLSVLVAAGLIVDGIIHLHLAHNYDLNGNDITQGTLFRLEASIALLFALLVLVLPLRRTVFGLTFLVAASAFGAVMLYRYVNVGSIGPLPNMYEPIWYTSKTVSAIAEGAAALIALWGFGFSFIGQQKPAAS